MSIKRNSKGQFVKGQNSKGRPAKAGRKKTRRRIEHILQAIGDETVKTKDGKTMTKLEAVLRKQFQKAIAGDPMAMKFISERTEGRVRDPIPVEKEKNHEIAGFDFKEVNNGTDDD